ncbi:hypothetical protein ACQY0O_000449 [Thecaphora frezii]
MGISSPIDSQVKDLCSGAILLPTEQLHSPPIETRSRRIATLLDELHSLSLSLSWTSRLLQPSRGRSSVKPWIEETSSARRTSGRQRIAALVAGMLLAGYCRGKVRSMSKGSAKGFL